jgi:hypothetical protein
MRTVSRRLILWAAAAMLATLGLAAPAQAGAAGQGPALNRAYQHLLRMEAAREARMAARQLAGPALPTGLRPTAPAVVGQSQDVQQIAEDTLKAGEQGTQVEPDMAMDPNNADGLVAVVQQGRFKTGGSADPGFATSLDGGKTWASGNLPGLTKAVGGPFDRGSDPNVAFGPNHVAYASTIDFTFGHKDCPSAVGVNVSTDGGLTWGDPVFPENDTSCDVFNDKNWLTVDTNPASPFFGRAYLVWSLFSPVASPAVLRYSDDGGQTWSDLIYASSQSAQSEGLIPLVHSNGDLTIVYDQTVGAQDLEVAQTSTDGGLSFGSPVTIAEFLGAGDPGLRTGGLPAAAIDPTTDDLYVVWQDTRFRADGHNDIVISSSTDGGLSWSDPARVNGPDPQGQVLDHFTPDVAAYGGAVHVTYRTRDFASKRASEFVDERYIASADGGASFGTELILGPPTDLKYAAQVTGSRAFLGDYMAVVANGQVAHAAWCVALFSKNSRYNQTLWSGTIVP